ncbi:MAG: type IV pilus modification protein PilV [Undibacterium sp.]|nr:type IV pilus modification protein PilV [Undibacterium sp.]
MRTIEKNQTGTTLIEVMVSVLVLAIGLLGIAGLQANALKYQKTSSYRSEASQIAYDLSDRLRANSAGFANYIYSKTYAQAAADIPAPESSLPCALAVNCNPALIADFDKRDLRRNLNARLAGGALNIVQDMNTTTRALNVTLMWKEPGFSVADGSCPNGIAPAGVRCFTLRVSL